MSLQRDAVYDWGKSIEHRDEYQVDASQICRICAQFSDGLVPVFGKNGAKMDLINKIHTHLPIEVTMYDVLPLSCCNHCIEKLNACHELVNRCLEADWKLRTLLQGDKPLIEYSKTKKNHLQELHKSASLRASVLPRNSIAETDQHLIHTPKTYAKRILKGLKRKSHLQEDGDPNLFEAEEIHISYTAQLPILGKEDCLKTYTVKRKCSRSTSPDKEKTLQALPVKQKETQKYKVVLVKLKNSASLSKAVQLEKALKIVKSKQEAGDLPEAKGPVPKRLHKKLQGLKTYGLLKPNKYIRLPLEPRDYQTEDTSKRLTVPDDFICPSCENMFKDIDALNSHVAASHKDLLFCYCSQTFETQIKLNEHLELHVLEEIDCEPSNSHVTEEIDCESLKPRVTEEVESEPLKSRLKQEIESKPSECCVMAKIEGELTKSHLKQEIEHEPSESSPIEIREPFISKVVPQLQVQTPKLWTMKLEDSWPNSTIRKNTANDQVKSVKTLVDIRSNPLTKEEISHDKCENVTKMMGDSPRSLNAEASGNNPAISCENRPCVGRKYIDLTKGNQSDVDSKCESRVAFSSLDESRVLMDSIIASVPKTKTKIWRCPMCGLVYPGEDRWLKHCEGIDFRCHFCKVVLGSLLEQKQHETEHLRAAICSKPSCLT